MTPKPGSPTTQSSTGETGSIDRRRTRSGCGACKDGKVKCHEERPQCRRCVRLGHECDYSVRPRKKYSKRRTAAASSTTPSANEAAPSSLATHAVEAAAQGSSRGSHHDDGFLDLSGAFEIATYSPTPPGGWEIEVSPECAHVISVSDHAAIHCFRSLVSVALDDTKSPEHSGPALSWTLAQKSPMVLHMVCALGGRKLRCQAGSSPEAGGPMDHSPTAEEHYAAALRLLAENTQVASKASDFDYILATIWLMIAYEHKHGDGCGVGLFAHLRGATSLLQEHVRSLRGALAEDHYQITGQDSSIGLASSEDRPGRISTLAARMMVWIAFIDGGAALHSLGGVFNEVLGEAMSDPAEDPAIAPLRGFCALQRYSTPVYRDVWGTSYPQDQLVEDLQSSQIFCMHAELAHMRYLLATLAAVDRGSSEAVMREGQFVRALRDVQMRYSELLAAANSYTNSLRRPGGMFVMNLLTVVPFYLAIILGFFRLTRETEPLHEGQRKALGELLSLAFQSYQAEGVQAMARIAWPLFIAALETGDMIQRQWIMERFVSLSARGENYCRARNSLLSVFTSQGPDGRRPNYWELVRRSDLDTFVL